MPSARNADTVGIPPGFAVVVSQDKAKLAGGTVLASHMVSSGAPVGGVVSTQSDGVIELRNWTKATGNRLLTPGKTYYVTQKGLISPVGSGQAVGAAVSTTELEIHIDPNFTPYIIVPTFSIPTPTPTNAPAQQLSGSGPPSARLGVKGNWYHDTSNQVMYGPKDPFIGWGIGYPLTS